MPPSGRRALMIVGHGHRSNGDIINDQMTSFTGWVDGDLGNGVSSIAVVDGSNGHKYTSTAYAANNRARRTNATYFTPNAVKNYYSMNLYITDLAAHATEGRFSFQLSHSVGVLSLDIYSDKISVFADAGATVIDTAFPQGVRTWLDLIVTESTETLDMWINDVEIATGIDANAFSGGTTGLLAVVDRLNNGTETMAHVSQLLIGSKGV